MLERALQPSHVLKPGSQHAEDIIDGSRHAQRIDVLCQRTVLYLGGIAVHAAEGERLHGRGQGGDAVREPGPQTREIEVDQRVAKMREGIRRGVKQQIS